MDKERYIEHLELSAKIISWEWTVDDRHLRLSARADAVLGIRDSAITLNKFIRLVPAGDRDFVISIIRSIQSGLPINKFYFPVVIEQQERHLSVQVVTKGSDSHQLTGFAQDITEIKNALRVIDDQNDNLNEISWTQSHVLRSPVATILGLLNMWQDTGDEHEKEQIIEWIKENVVKLDDIIRDISDKASLP